MAIWRVVLWITVALISAGLAHYVIEAATVPWFLAGLVVGLAIHEGGHALSARLVGKQLMKISIGTGPAVFHKRFDEVTFEWRLLPFAGIVLCYPELSHRNRASQALFLLGGVLANLIVASLLLGSAVCRQNLSDRLS